MAWEAGDRAFQKARLLQGIVVREQGAQVCREIGVDGLERQHPRLAFLDREVERAVEVWAQFLPAFRAEG